MFELVDGIDAARDAAEVWDVYMNAATAAGFPFGVACVHPSSGRVLDHIMGIRMPPGWVPHYAERGYDRLSPVTGASQQATGFRWTVGQWDGRLSREQRTWRDDVLGAGMAGGLSIPDHSQGARKALVLSGPVDDADPDDLTALRLAGVEALRRMHELTLETPRPTRTLSPREGECLSWVAQGKSDWEIGQILGLSEKTVNHHVERAKRRLSVPTRVQAVVAAVVGNLIRI
ncbi:MAG: LuxR C-terminal-related transcriptional regulator [Alphaproteobacteria bacterium]|nr:LuxR C-terminal-related transcriptional regulator [Alphaproteobacteria bacterium]MBU1516196.1 LuxR C-terminal-related transcriptional regulator [Alphaproteobacteria bacterium]MBU2093506.1 LuxR C-terminal-related transcriptional regulator [Alphaproteobacteria bacterium]MBU2152354.1 LuxR C-terminal-related transcriptional regulator [Alphaproteobacteria bacterium]MBU2308168.1 LuxR C-terminal-related transcriptional regulator [Alphaproteobacteria bacterium]